MNSVFDSVLIWFQFSLVLMAGCPGLGWAELLRCSGLHMFLAGLGVSML